jgi:4-hydroxybenzoate polyprenyltransferase
MLAQRLGHLAVWVGLYVAGATVGFARLAGLPMAPAAIGAAFCTATSVYLVDRVKLRDAWLDRADLEAHPARYAFLTRRTGLVRALAAVLGVAGAGLAATLGAWAPLLVVAAYGGVFVYAGRRAGTGRRVKDLLLVKNFAVAGSIAGFAGAMAMLGALARGWAWTESAPHDLLLGLVFLGGQVLADAVLCDLDDAESDRRFGTATVPAKYGRGAAWALALAVHAGLTALMVAWPAGAGAYAARWRWGLLTLGTTVALRRWNPPKVRDLVDLRLALVAGAALAMA